MKESQDFLDTEIKKQTIIALKLVNGLMTITTFWVLGLGVVNLIRWIT